MKSLKIFELETPIGTIQIENGNEKIPFTVTKNSYDVPYEIYDKNNKFTGKILNTKTNYIIVINTKDLTVGDTNKIYFPKKKLKFIASDQNTEALTLTQNGWTVGVGAYDPNDDEKIEQARKYTKQLNPSFVKGPILEPNRYDETKFVRYSIDRLENESGYKFKLLDRTNDKICFKVAWIKHEGLKPSLYEDAIGFWLT